MTRQMTATELKAKLLAVLDEVAQGDEVEVTKHGRTVARLVPARGPAALKGKFAGIVTSSPNDEDLFGTGERWEME